MHSCRFVLGGRFIKWLLFTGRSIVFMFRPAQFHKNCTSKTREMNETRQFAAFNGSFIFSLIIVLIDDVRAHRRQDNVPGLNFQLPPPTKLQ